MSLGLRPTSLPSGILIQATTDMGRKLGDSAPFWGGGAVSPSNTMWPGPRPTCMPSFILINPAVWPQYTNVTDRQDRQSDRQQSDSIGRTIETQVWLQEIGYPLYSPQWVTNENRCLKFLHLKLLIKFCSPLSKASYQQKRKHCVTMPSQTECLPYFHPWCGLSANLRCRSETSCTRLTKSTGRKSSPSGHRRRTLLGYIFATKARIDNRKKTC